MTQIQKLIVLLIILFSSVFAVWGQATYVWEGNTDNNWSVSTNWDRNDGTYPGQNIAGDTVVIPLSSLVNLDTPLTYSLTSLNNSGTLTLGGYSITGTVTNTGTINATGSETIGTGTTIGGRVVFTGTGNLCGISSFVNLTISSGSESEIQNASGSITVSNEFSISNGTLTGPGTLTLSNTATQTGGSIQFADLVLNGNNIVYDFSSATNDVDTISTGASTGAITFVDSDDLAIGTAGITTDDAIVDLTGTSLIINAPIDAGTGTVILTSSGTTDGTGIITANELVLNGNNGTYELTGANDVTAISTGGVPTGAITFINNGPLGIASTGILTSSGGTVNLSTTGSYNITVGNAIINAPNGTVTLTSAGTTNGTGVITAGTLVLDGNDGIYELTGDNKVASITAGTDVLGVEKIIFKNDDAININGLNLNGGCVAEVSTTNNYNIRIKSPIDSGSGTSLTLTSKGEVTQDAEIKVATLILNGEGTYKLDNPANAVTRISTGGASTGAISFTNNASLQIGDGTNGIKTNNNANVTLTMDAYTFAGSGIDAGTGTVQITPLTPGYFIEYGDNELLAKDVYYPSNMPITAASLIIGEESHTGPIYMSGVANASVNLSLLNSTGSGKIHLSGNYIDTASANSLALTSSDVIVEDDSRTVTALGGISFTSNISTDAGRNLTLDAGTANISVTGTVGTNTMRLGALKISNATNVQFDDVIYATSFTQAAGAGATTFNRAQNYTGAFSFTGNILNINNTLTVTGTTSPAVSINNGGVFTSTGSITANEGFTQNGTGANRIGAGITTTANNISFDKAITLTGVVTFSTVAKNSGGDIIGGGHITLNSTLTSNNSSSLTLASGTGDIDVLGSVGTAGSRLGSLTISNANKVVFSEVIYASNFTQEKGEATTVFNSEQNYSEDFSFTGTNLTVDKTLDVAGTATITNSGLFTTTGSITADGGFTQNDTDTDSTNNTDNTNSIGANITTDNTNISFATAILLTLEGTTTFSTGTGAGNITLSGAVTHANTTNKNFTLNAGAGNIAINNSINVDTGTLTLTSTGSTSQIAASIITANELVLNGSGGTYQLIGTNNDVNTISTGSIRTGSIQFTNSTAFAVGIGANGITTNGADVTLTGAVSVTQTAAILIGSGNLILSGMGSYTLTNPSNIVGTLSTGTSTGTGEIQFTDNTGFRVGNATYGIKTNGADVTLTSAGTVNQYINPTNNSEISIDTDAAISTSGTLILNGSGTYTLNNSGNTVGSISTGNRTVGRGGAISFANSVTLTIGDGNYGITTANPDENVDVTLFVDSYNFETTPNAGFINVGLGTIQIAPFIKTKSISFGNVNSTPAADIHYSAGVLTSITAAALTIGRAEHTGTIYLTTVNDPSPYNLTLWNSAAPGEINIDGNYKTANKSLTLMTNRVNVTGSTERIIDLGISAFSVTAPVVLRNSFKVTANGGITFGSTLSKTGSASANLTLTAGSGDISIAGAVGSEGTPVGAITITNGGTFIKNTGNIFAAIFTQNGSGTNSIGADITTTNTNISFAKSVTLSGNVTFSTGASGIGDIIFSETINGTPDLTLETGTGDISVTGAVGSGTALGNISITSAASVDFYNTVSAVSFTQSAGTGTTTFDGAQNYSGAFSFAGTALTINNVLNVTGTTTITNSALFKTSSNISINANGGFTQNGSGGNSIDGNIMTIDTPIIFASPIILTFNRTTTFSTGVGTIGDISLSNSITPALVPNCILILEAGIGNVKTVNIGAPDNNSDTIPEWFSKLTISGGTVTLKGDVYAEGLIHINAIDEENPTITNNAAIHTGPVADGANAVEFYGNYINDTNGRIIGSLTTNPNIIFKNNVTFNNPNATELRNDVMKFEGALTQNFNPGENLFAGTITIANADGVILTGSKGVLNGKLFLQNGKLSIDDTSAWLLDTSKTSLAETVGFSGVNGTLSLGDAGNSKVSLSGRGFRTTSTNFILETAGSGKKTIISSGNIIIDNSTDPAKTNFSSVDFETFGAGNILLHIDEGADRSTPVWQIKSLTVNDSIVTLDVPLSVSTDININSGVLDVSPSNHGITIGRHWMQNTSSSDAFIPRNGTVYFTASNTNRITDGRPAIYIYGSTTWWNFSSETAAAITIQFSRNASNIVKDTIFTFQNEFRVSTSDTTQRTLLTKMFDADYAAIEKTPPPDGNGNPSPESPSTHRSYFWNITIAQDDLVFDNVTVKYSWSDPNTILVLYLNFATVDATPYLADPISPDPYDHVPHYCVGWTKGVEFIYSFTEDSDHNGRIDRIRVQTAVPFRNDFTAFSIEVEGYKVLDYVKYDPNPYLFYILLEEQSYADGGDAPSWKLITNETLTEDILGQEVFSTVAPEMIPLDTTWPVVSYSLMLPKTEGERQDLFIQFSEPVTGVNAAGIEYLEDHFIGQSMDTVTQDEEGNSSEYLIHFNTADSVSIEDMAAEKQYAINNAASILDFKHGVGHLLHDLVAIGYPLPIYPDDENYSAYTTFPLDNNPPAAALLTTSSRITDVLVSIQPTSPTDKRFFAWPIFGRDEIGFRDSFQPADQIDLVAIREFDGTATLRDMDITLDVTVNPLFNATPDLILGAGIPNSQRGSHESVSKGLWLPYNSGLVPSSRYQGIPKFEQYQVDSTSSGNLVYYKLKEAHYEHEDIVDFYFSLPGMNNLAAGRLDGTTAGDWYRRIKPFSFNVKELVLQRGGATILNNVINPTKGERVYLDYTLTKGGQVTVQVFTLDGNMVQVLYRGSRAPGDYMESWDGKNRGGRVVARGMYFIRIVAPGIDEIRKVMVVK